MSDSPRLNMELLANLLRDNIFAHNAKRRSKAEKAYSAALRTSADILREIAQAGTFDDAITTEMSLAQDDLKHYSQNPDVQRNVQDGIDDLEAGLSDYRTLMEEPESYFKKRYVKREMAGADKEVPIDSMRKALRSQASRIASYAASPMANEEERDFQKARLLMLRKGERLYDRIQRKQKAHNVTP